MTCAEVREHLHDHFDGLLNPEAKDEVDRHLQECDDCYQYYKSLKEYFYRTKEFDYLIDAPEDIPGIVYSTLLERSTSASEEKKERVIDKKQIRRLRKERARQEKVIKSFRKKIKNVKEPAASIGFAKPANKKKSKLLWFFVSILIITGAVYAYGLMRTNDPWKIRNTGGQYTINGVISNAGKLYANDNLATGDSTGVIVSIPEVGKIEVKPKSAIALVKAKNSNNIIRLNKGSVRVTTSADFPNFSIMAGPYLIYDKGGNFVTEIDDNKNIKVEVLFGVAAIEHNGQKLPLAEGYCCFIMNGKKPGIPYNINTSEKMKQDLYNYDNPDGGSPLLNDILDESKDIDALSLWTLLQKVNPGDRVAVMEKIRSFFPMPDGVTTRGILVLDKDQLNTWWDEIEWQL